MLSRRSGEPTPGELSGAVQKMRTGGPWLLIGQVGLQRWHVGQLLPFFSALALFGVDFTGVDLSLGSRIFPSEKLS